MVRWCGTVPVPHRQGNVIGKLGDRGNFDSATGVILSEEIGIAGIVVQLREEVIKVGVELVSIRRGCGSCAKMSVVQPR